MKKFICALCALFLTSTLFALDMPFFSGYAGFLGNFTNEADSKDFNPELEVESFFSAQLDFNGKFIARGEFYIDSENLLDDNIFKDITDPNASFKIEELSATLKTSTLRSSHYFSLFLGNYEPIGSDIFLRRQFGIHPMTSPITESWHGLTGASVYPFYGAGFSYVYHPETPWAFALYLYKNQQTAEDGSNINVINTDLRLSTVRTNFIVDFAGGLAFPLDNSDDSGTQVVLIVREVQFHAGFNMLLGNRTKASAFFQGGFNKFVLSSSNGSSNSISFSDLYFLFEPRFNFRNFMLNITAFNLPRNSADDMLYLSRMATKEETVKNLLGLNLSVITDHLYLGNTNYTFGIHTTFSFTNSDLEALKSDFKVIKDWDYDLYITPFISMPILGGTLNGAVSVSTLDLTENWLSSIYATIGFRTQF